MLNIVAFTLQKSKLEMTIKLAITLGKTVLASFKEKCPPGTSIYTIMYLHSLTYSICYWYSHV